MTSLLYVCAALAFVFATYLGTATERPRTAHRLLATVFALVAIQFLLAKLQMIQPGHLLVPWRIVTAMAIPPLLFLHLECAGRQLVKLDRNDLVHLTGPILIIILRLIGAGGWAIDLTIIIATAIYAGLIFSHAKSGRSNFNGRGSISARALRHWRWMIIGWLCFSVFLDTIIMIEVDQPSALESSIAFSAAVILLILFFVYALLASLHRAGPMAWVAARMRIATTTPFDIKILDAHMHKTKPYLDPNLTIVQLARQMSQPQRVISETINHSTGVSFSQWINQWRIEEAKALIVDDPDKGLLDIMLSAGFQSKSNFNKSFKDIVGLTPSEWRKQL